MKRSFAIVPKRRSNHNEVRLPLLNERNAQRKNGTMSYSSIIFVLGLVALSTAPVHPALPRLLSKLTNSLHPYQNEIPIGAPRPTTFLLGIFTTAREKDAVQNGLIRQSYLSIGDARICSLEEFIRQAEETPD
jgi:hypothetical protein